MRLGNWAPPLLYGALTALIACARSELPAPSATGVGEAGSPAACFASAEICDGLDNDCNGVIDDPFLDGLRSNGCDCEPSSLLDAAGPPGDQGLDDNCDGADGVVSAALYVTPSGDDAAQGTPSLPLRSISEAIRRSFSSLTTHAPRPDVFIAGGSYRESLTLRDGVRLHGGYRRDFLALDVETQRVEVRAPSAAADFDEGAALIARDTGVSGTLVEGLTLLGADARRAGVPAIGLLVVDPGPNLILRHLVVRSGTTLAGTNGAPGEAGAAPSSAAQPGDPARPASEDTSHQCRSFDPNLVAGGVGGRNHCDGVDVGGGDGGISHCPNTTSQNVRGLDGRDASTVKGGLGGLGGSSREGPVLGGRDSGCEGGVCCNGTYLSLPFSEPESGAPGRDGLRVSSGASCADALGSYQSDRWMPGTARPGARGNAGSGAGGGGSGGGLLMNWSDAYASFCGYPDGLGGGGGGAGAGGCGGSGGGAATSAAPTIAMLLRFSRSPHLWPVLEASLLAPSSAANGGHGGRGGVGAAGGLGAPGTPVAAELALRMPFSGTQAGARGGNGGHGSDGGGGGGGCGGAVVGLWIAGAADRSFPASYRAANQFSLGVPGQGGRDGVGDRQAENGAAFHVVSR